MTVGEFNLVFQCHKTVVVIDESWVKLVLYSYFSYLSIVSVN